MDREALKGVLRRAPAFEVFVRRNKAHEDGRQYEVVKDWGGDVISDETMAVVARCVTEREAQIIAEDWRLGEIADRILAAMRKAADGS